MSTKKKKPLPDRVISGDDTILQVQCSESCPHFSHVNGGVTNILGGGGEELKLLDQ